MNIIGSGAAPTIQTSAPYDPLRRATVGQESAEGKAELVPPVEQPDASTTSQNRTSAQSSPTDTRQQAAGAAQQTLSEAELQQVSELAARDREVRAHEAAHAAVGGALAGAPRYSFQRGPNGVRYAVSGEVSINLSSDSSDPEATLRRAEQVQAAALAPAQPSAQDQRVATDAAQIALQAQQQIALLRARSQQVESAGTAANVAGGSGRTSAAGLAQLFRDVGDTLPHPGVLFDQQA